MSSTLNAEEPVKRKIFYNNKVEQSGPDEKDIRSRIVPFPAVFYTPETKLGGAGSFVYFTYGDDKIKPRRPDTISAVAFYTQKKQSLGALSYKNYFYNCLFLWSLKGSFSDFEKKFYGIGSNTKKEDEEIFINRKYSCLTSIQIGIIDNLYFGAVYNIQKIKALDIEKGRIIDTHSISGIEGGIVSGIGGILSFDSRDNSFSPGRGVLADISIIPYRSYFRSDYTYAEHRFDIRIYQMLPWKDVMAFQFLCIYNTKNPPFQVMPELGGQNIMRGYYQGRYRDKAYTASQLEYRFFIYEHFVFRVPCW